MTLRSHLITLVLVAVLPLLVFSAIVLALAADSERDATERGLRATGRAVGTAVDHTLDKAIGALELLASSQLLDAGDLPAFRAAAVRAPASSRYTGQPARPEYVAFTERRDGGAARLPGLDGLRRHTVFSRLQHARWTVYLALPATTMDAVLQRSLWALIGGGIFFLAAGLVLAVFVGRRVAAP